ncbi:MAG: hypothetical protein ACHQPH_11605 [Reyranellales bacterium]|jgi:hypothetical protein
MFMIRFPSQSQILAYAVRAHQLRSVAVVAMIRKLGRMAKLGR